MVEDDTLVICGEHKEDGAGGVDGGERVLLALLLWDAQVECVALGTCLVPMREALERAEAEVVHSARMRAKAVDWRRR